jgi:hypothetical protein
MEQPAVQRAIGRAYGGGEPCRAYRLTLTQVRKVAWVCNASSEVPVTSEPTAKVKLHEARENGRPRRAVRSVIVAARSSQMIANPQTGIP